MRNNSSSLVARNNNNTSSSGRSVSFAATTAGDYSWFTEQTNELDSSKQKHNHQQEEQRKPKYQRNITSLSMTMANVDSVVFLSTAVSHLRDGRCI